MTLHRETLLEAARMKQRVLKEHPHAAVMKVLWGYRIVNYNLNGPGYTVLSGLRAYHHTEAQAWAAAAKRLAARDALKGKR